MFTELFMNTAATLVWQVALILVIYLCLLALIPRDRGQLRYRITAVIIFILPLCAVVNLAVSYERYARAAQPAEPTGAVDPQTGKTWLALSDDVDGNGPVQEYSFRKSAVQTLAYVTGSSGLLTVLLMALYYQLRHYGLLNTSNEVSGETKEIFAELVEAARISRSLRLYQNDTVAAVSMTGLRQPAVIMPVALNGCDREFIRIHLAWQLAKIKLNGNLLGYLCNVMNGLFFYNPAAWLVCHAVRKELRAGYLNMTEDLIEAKLSDVILEQAENSAETVSKGLSVLFKHSTEKLLTAVKTIPKMASSLMKSPVNAASLLLLAAVLVLPSGLMLYRSGDRVLLLFADYQHNHLKVIQNSLFKAAGSGDLSRVRDLLSKHPELLDSRDDTGRTLLHCAAQYSEGVPVVDYLIGHGIDIDALDHHFRTAIHSYPGSEDTVRLLQMHGLRLDVFAAAGHGRSQELENMLNQEPGLLHAVDRSGRTLLDHAAQTDHLETAKMLFEKGLDPDIYWASRLNLDETLRHIVENKNHSFTPDPLLPYGGPLDTAVRFGYADVVGILLEAGAGPEGDLDFEDRPLRQAVKRGYSDIARILLVYNARPVIHLLTVDKDTGEAVLCSSGDVAVSGFQHFSKYDFFEDGLLLDIPDEGVVAIKCHSDGYVPMRISWDVDHFIPATYQLALNKGDTIGGSVYDTAGSPVKSVRLFLEIRPNFLRYNVACVDISTTVHTDSNGAWQCGGVPTNLEKLSVYIDHPDYFADDTYRLAAMPTSEAFRATEAVFVLPKRIRLAGDVVDQNGNPIRHATVTLVSQGNDISCKSDRQGKFVLEDVPTVKVYLETVAGGFARNLVMLEPTEAISDCRILMKSGRTITLQAVDALSGEPLSKVDIDILYWKGFSTGLRLKTDKRGRTVWPDAPVDDLWLTASAHGYQMTKVFVNNRQDEYAVRLHKPVTVTGRITDADTGNPIEHFSIYAKHESVDCLTQQSQKIVYEPETFTSAEGVYSIEQRIAELSHTLHIVADGYEPITSELFFDDHGDIVMDFELNRQSWIKGVVLGAKGTAAVGAVVMLIESDMLASLVNTSVVDRDEGVQVIETDDAGNYQFPCPNKKWSIVAYNDEGYKRMSQGDYENNNTMTLEPWGVLEGHVLLDNVPLKNQTVVVNPKRAEIAGTLWHSYKSRTDENGKFEVHRMAPATYWIGLPAEARQGFIPEIAEIEIHSAQTMNLKIECITQ